jgi:hypothetical protein
MFTGDIAYKDISTLKTISGSNDANSKPFSKSHIPRGTATSALHLTQILLRQASLVTFRQ